MESDRGIKRKRGHAEQENADESGNTPHTISRAAQNPSTNKTKMENYERGAKKRRTRHGQIKL